MARNSDKIYMLLATFARLGVGMVTFILLARFLGPTPYGILAGAMAYSGLINLLTDFGFAISALRTASADVANSGAIVRRVLVSKVALTALALAIAVPVVMLTVPAARWPIYALAMAGTSANALAELCIIAARARRRFDAEAVLVIGNSVVMTAIVGAVAITRHDLLASTMAFAASRVLYLVITAFSLRKWLELGKLTKVGVRQIAESLKAGSGFAIDGGLTNVAGQIDVLVFSVLLGAHELGVYQAGARLVQVISPLAVVLSTVYMPSLSAAAINHDNAGFEQASFRLNVEFTLLALLAGAAFTFAGPLLTRLVYGHAYDALLPLWGGFGAYAVLRLSTSAYGIQLAALGAVRVRIGTQLASILFFLTLTFVVFPHQGLTMAPLELAASNAIITAIYSVALGRTLKRRASLATTAVLALGSALGFCFVY